MLALELGWGARKRGREGGVRGQTLGFSDVGRGGMCCAVDGLRAGCRCTWLRTACCGWGGTEQGAAKAARSSAALQCTLVLPASEIDDVRGSTAHLQGTWLPCAVCHVLHAVCHVLRAVCHALCATCCVSCVQVGFKFKYADVGDALRNLLR